MFLGKDQSMALDREGKITMPKATGTETVLTLDQHKANLRAEVTAMNLRYSTTPEGEERTAIVTRRTAFLNALASLQTLPEEK